MIDEELLIIDIWIEKHKDYKVQIYTKNSRYAYPSEHLMYYLVYQCNNAKF